MATWTYTSEATGSGSRRAFTSVLFFEGATIGSRRMDRGRPWANAGGEEANETDDRLSPRAASPAAVSSAAENEKNDVSV